MTAIASQKLGQHRLTPGAQRLFDRAKDDGRAVCTALDGFTTWPAVKRAEREALAAAEHFLALAQALEIEGHRMRAMDRQSRKFSARLKAYNAKIKAGRAAA